MGRGDDLKAGSAAIAAIAADASNLVMLIIVIEGHGWFLGLCTGSKCQVPVQAIYALAGAVSSTGAACLGGGDMDLPAR